MDEKSQIQALERSQPVLPMLPGPTERRTHEDLRHGVTSLLAALDIALGIASGQVISSLHRRHRWTEFRQFLVKLDRQVPGELDVHWSAITTPPTPPTRSGAGWPPTHAFMCTWSRRSYRGGP